MNENNYKMRWEQGPKFSRNRLFYLLAIACFLPGMVSANDAAIAQQTVAGPLTVTASLGESAPAVPPVAAAVPEGSVTEVSSPGEGTQAVPGKPEADTVVAMSNPDVGAPMSGEPVDVTVAVKELPAAGTTVSLPRQEMPALKADSIDLSGTSQRAPVVESAAQQLLRTETLIQDGEASIQDTTAGHTGSAAAVQPITDEAAADTDAQLQSGEEDTAVSGGRRAEAVQRQAAVVPAEEKTAAAGSAALKVETGEQPLATAQNKEAPHLPLALVLALIAIASVVPVSRRHH